MKIIVIGNPPYQIPDLGHINSAKPAYNLFMEAIIDNIAPDYFTMLVPSRWMSAGKGLKKFRERMMNDTRMKKIIHLTDSAKLFKGCAIIGGVNYFLWCKDYNGDCDFNGVVRSMNEFAPIIIPDNTAVEILRLVKSKWDNYISLPARNNFMVRSNFKDYGNGETICYSRGRTKNLISNGKFVDRNNMLHKYKCVIASTNGGDLYKYPMFVCPKPWVIGPGEIVSETYNVIYTDDTMEEVENFSAYIRTKFFRFMVLMCAKSSNFSNITYQFVPDMGDYSKVWTDQELYSLFGLSRQHIDYIESLIKPMENK